MCKWSELYCHKEQWPNSMAHHHNQQHVHHGGCCEKTTSQTQSLSELDWERSMCCAARDGNIETAARLLNRGKRCNFKKRFIKQIPDS
eukprot:m.203209 g.203209  ORF g.203209 m.203209 type:complete len:88 (+) comp15758_c0_seq7:114-377(+)